MTDTREFYLQRFEKFAAINEKVKRYSNKLSNLRLVFFVAAAVLTILAFYYIGQKWGYIILTLAAVTFIALLIYHDKVIKRADYYYKMAQINKNCLQRIDGDWIHFSDQGQEYINPGHPYADDLDIYGQASLFQWLNTTNTYHGRKYLRMLLDNPVKDKNSIKQRQGAVKELAANFELCQALQCEGMGSGDISKDPEKLFVYAEDQGQLLKRPWLKIIFYIIPALTILTIALCFFFTSFNRVIPFVLFFLQLMINFWTGKKINMILSTVFAYKTKVNIYQHLLGLLENAEFKDSYLAELKADFYNDKRLTASEQIRELDRIVGRVAFKYNPIVYFIINNLLFWDFHCLFALEKWKERSGKDLRKWINNVGIYEALANLAMVSQLNPEWCFPEFAQSQLFIEAQALGHPLISARHRVNNDLKIENQIAVITGSNMSGKTTLLRTIGINLVLAYAGAPVCAGRFHCSIMEILTSMRISDDLSSGISTFYAELLRIKMIIDFSKKEAPMIFLIDEVFRGTNSRDRVIGARNVLLNLNKSWIIGLISTHDYELCDLENEDKGRIVNYHFIENYHDGEIDFDYLLRSGPCKTSNAKYLMKMAGIEMAD